MGGQFVSRVMVLGLARLHREVLAQCLAAHPEFEIVDARDGWNDAPLDRIPAVDVVVVDTPSLAESAVPPCLRQYDGTARIIAIAGCDDFLGAGWVQAGLVGLIPTDASKEDLVDAVRKACAGEFVYTPVVAAKLLSRLACLSHNFREADSVSRLTFRESEILEHLERGLSNKEIARNLTIETATVKNHVHSILSKLNVKRRSEIPQLLRDLENSDGPLYNSRIFAQRNKSGATNVHRRYFGH
jgi:two-component system nitrate/nitrite response regulator NarL